MNNHDNTENNFLQEVDRTEGWELNKNWSFEYFFPFAYLNTMFPFCDKCIIIPGLSWTLSCSWDMTEQLYTQCQDINTNKEMIKNTIHRWNIFGWESVKTDTNLMPIVWWYFSLKCYFECNRKYHFEFWMDILSIPITCLQIEIDILGFEWINN